MFYLPEQKQQLDEVLTVFQDFIKKSADFDIVYSEKVGYLRIDIWPGVDCTHGELVQFCTAEELLKVLYNEIMLSVMFSGERGEHDGFTPSGEEQAELKLWVTAILSKAEGVQKDFYFRALERFLEHHLAEGA